MIDKQNIFEIHRLHHLNWSYRKIARTLGIDRDTVKNYVNDPQRKFKRSAARNLKLDPFRQLIAKWLEEDKEVKAPVVLQRLQANGFDGQITIVRDYLRHLRGPQKKRQAFLRFESLPGEQMQIDWGHFGSLVYAETKIYSQPEPGKPASVSFKRLCFLWGIASRNPGGQHAHRCY
jgi:transposase